ncbi:MAG: hypothetical protein J5U17_06570 [Candidatus Methanoperedens sp.]|nr:hypothetical protein [Candidatus Methanoperedens sp.]MCE8427840.1 hypothetical protein [Candidatus Methanoperedens sp.]
MDIEKISLKVKGEEIRIPQELINEFGKELRIVIDQHTSGIWAPPDLDPEVFKGLFKDFDVILTPKILER